MDCSGVVYLNIKQCFDYICFKKDMILDIDSVIPFSKRHGGETIREIIRYDSGYLKDLMLKDDRVVFSDTCFNEIKRLTKNHFDNWETPSNSGISIFKKLKTYGQPYLYDFNDGELEALNKQRLSDYGEK